MCSGLSGPYGKYVLTMMERVLSEMVSLYKALYSKLGVYRAIFEL